MKQGLGDKVWGRGLSVPALHTKSRGPIPALHYPRLVGCASNPSTGRYRQKIRSSRSTSDKLRSLGSHLKIEHLSNPCKALDSIPTTETKTKTPRPSKQGNSDALDPIGLRTMKMEAWAMLSAWERQYRKYEEGLTLRWLCYLRVGC